MRLDASAQRPREGVSQLPVCDGTGKVCRECGGLIEGRKPEAEFCGLRCRKAFNNRRAMRGAELYDLFMAHRHERALAQALKVLRMMNRMAAHWWREDRARRSGRKSWRRPQVVLARHAHLNAEVLVEGRRKR